MKKLLLVTVILCSLSTIGAQNFKAELLLAPSFPLGDYGTTDINSENAESATFGLHAGAMGHLMLTKNIGASLHLGYNSNAMDEEEVEKQLKESNTATNWRFQGDNFRWIYAAIGPTFGHYTDGGYLRLSPFAGPAVFLEQEASVTANEGFIAVRSEAIAERTTDVIYGVNFAGGFYLVEGISLGLNITYMAANTERSVDLETFSSGIILDSSRESEDFEPQVFTAGISIGIDF